MFYSFVPLQNFWGGPRINLKLHTIKRLSGETVQKKNAAEGGSGFWATWVAPIPPTLHSLQI